MSNYLAIATVTAVFSQKIQAALNKVQMLSAAPQVVHRRPEKPDGQMVGVNLYMYDVEFNNSLRNNDLATRRADGSLIQQPQVPLNLKYHLSFYGQESTLETQRMMGAIIVELHAQPFITPDEIEQYIKTVGPDNLLAASDLQKQNARIKIEPVLLSMEDVTKMWSSFFQLPHQHSLNYEISVILMESDFPIEKSLPTRNVNHSAAATQLPEIQEITPPLATVDDGKQLITVNVRGIDSSAEVYFEEAAIRVKPDSFAPGSLTFTLPREVIPGSNSVRLLKTLTEQGEVHVIKSEVFPFIAQPVLDNLQFHNRVEIEGVPQRLLTLEMQPFPQDGQKLDVWLNNKNPNAQHFQIARPLWFKLELDNAELRTEDLPMLTKAIEEHGLSISDKVRLISILPGSKWLLHDVDHFMSLQKQVAGGFLCCYGFSEVPSMKALAFDAESLKAGDYMVRIQVDKLKQAQSPLSREEDISSPSYGQYNGPVVSVL